MQNNNTVCTNFYNFIPLGNSKIVPTLIVGLTLSVLLRELSSNQIVKQFVEEIQRSILQYLPLVL